MSQEARTRITLLLPFPALPQQFLLFDEVLSQLADICGGVTASSLSEGSFAGWWFDASATLIKDSNVLIFADAPYLPDDQDLLDFLDALKIAAQENFKQDIVWITMHPIRRITTRDPKA